MKIPDCYEADRQAEARDLAYTARIMRRPLCQCCGSRILSETCVELESFGLSGYACERCVENHTLYTEELEEL